ncbi:MAG: hypothetical protein WCP92_08990 [bacterium]
MALQYHTSICVQAEIFVLQAEGIFSHALFQHTAVVLAQSVLHAPGIVSEFSFPLSQYSIHSRTPLPHTAPQSAGHDLLFSIYSGYRVIVPANFISFKYFVNDAQSFSVLGTAICQRHISTIPVPFRQQVSISFSACLHWFSDNDEQVSSVMFHPLVFEHISLFQKHHTDSQDDQLTIVLQLNPVPSQLGGTTELLTEHHGTL